MLNKKEITKWIKALRSGKYQQGKNRLTIVNGNKKKLSHCCLGVLCVIKKTPFVVSNDHLDGKFIKTRNYKFPDGSYPSGIRQDRSMVPKTWIPVGGLLATLNDTDNKNFSEIADYIEREILPLAPNE